MKTKYPIVKLTWIDAGQEEGWVDLKIMTPRSGLIEVENIGFLITKNDEYICMSHSIHSDGRIRDCFYVPLGMCRSLFEIQLPEVT